MDSLIIACFYREQDYKEKRKQTSAAQNMSGTAAAEQTKKSEESQQLVDVSIDEALSYIGKVGNNEFMREVQVMRFKVRFLFQLTFLISCKTSTD